MKSKHICPECGNKTFYTVAHVMQEWVVDENGNFVEVADECMEVTHGPDDGNFWSCTECGAYAIIV